jgi:hypothetical protein
MLNEVMLSGNRRGAFGGTDGSSPVPSSSESATNRSSSITAVAFRKISLLVGY